MIPQYENLQPIQDWSVLPQVLTVSIARLLLIKKTKYRRFHLTTNQVLVKNNRIIICRNLAFPAEMCPKYLCSRFESHSSTYTVHFGHWFPLMKQTKQILDHHPWKHTFLLDSTNECPSKAIVWRTIFRCHSNYKGVVETEIYNLLNDIWTSLIFVWLWKTNRACSEEQKSATSVDLMWSRDLADRGRPTIL